MLLFTASRRVMCALTLLAHLSAALAPANHHHRVHAKQGLAAPSRRALTQVVASAVAATVLPKRALSDDVPSREELLKLTKGYERLQELLTNWDAITVGACRGSVSKSDVQVVATNGVGCDKAPLKVQEYVGYKSINDPLFKADKLMRRALPLLPPDADIDEYLDAVNLWAEKAQMSSLNAYTSSWGEANPNGGQTKVAAFLDDAKFDVEESAKVLGKILKLLDLPLTTKKTA